MSGNATQATGSLADRFAVWRAGLAKVSREFRSQPEPRSIGLFARGRQLVAGNFVFAGQLVQAPGTVIWVRVRTVGLKGVMGAWSDPAKIMVV